jgi:hypothetical protein
MINQLDLGIPSKLRQSRAKVYAKIRLKRTKKTDSMAKKIILITPLSAVALVKVRGFVAEFDKGNIG